MQDRVRCLEDEIDGVVVDLHRRHVGGHAAFDLAVGRAQALQREDDVVGGEVFAAVELHALAQAEAPLQAVVQDLPFLGEAGHDLQVPVALGQRFHDVAERAEGERFIQRVGVERVEIALERVFEGLGVGGDTER